MSNYAKLIDLVLSEESKHEAPSGRTEELSRQLINELKMSHKQIAEKERTDSIRSKTYTLLQRLLEANSSCWFGFLKEFLELLYLKESPMLAIVYQFVPMMLRMFIELKEGSKDKNKEGLNAKGKEKQKASSKGKVKGEGKILPSTGLQGVVGVIRSYEMGAYSRSVKEREEIKGNPFVRDLYSIHFNSQLVAAMNTQENEENRGMVEEGGSNSGIDRELTKVILLFVIYRNLETLERAGLKEFLKTIYIYCGGEMKDYNAISSFYLLEKKNLFNPFRCAISQGEIEWMLLTLYELSIGSIGSVGSGRDRFQLLAAINMIYKKTANQSMFRFGEIAQSIIHILEDQYLEIFS